MAMPLKLIIAATVLLFHPTGSNVVAQIRDISGSQAPTEDHGASELHSTNDHERDQQGVLRSRSSTNTSFKNIGS